MRGFKTRPRTQNVPSADLAVRIRLGVVALLQFIMAVELALLLYDQRWVTAFLVLAIMLVSLLPYALSRHFRVHVPAEFQVLTVIFVFATLFLGEIRSYYERIWWWDMALHASSGLLLAIAGFLLVYVLNGNARVDLHLRPRFVALFAFLFAVTVGVLTARVTNIPARDGITVPRRQRHVPLTTSTAHGVSLRMRSDVLPSSTRSKALRPWLPVTIRSALRSRATSTIVMAG